MLCLEPLAPMYLLMKQLHNDDLMTAVLLDVVVIMVKVRYECSPIGSTLFYNNNKHDSTTVPILCLLNLKYISYLTF